MQMLMVSTWLLGRVVKSTLIADKEMPPASKAEAEKDTNWSKVAEYRRFREEHDHEFDQGLMSPKHFGLWAGMPDILGEPPPETVKTLAEVKRQEAERLSRLEEDTKVYFLEHSILARAAKAGKNFKPRGAPREKDSLKGSLDGTGPEGPSEPISEGDGVSTTARGNTEAASSEASLGGDEDLDTFRSS